MKTATIELSEDKKTLRVQLFDGRIFEIETARNNLIQLENSAGVVLWLTGMLSKNMYDDMILAGLYPKMVVK